MLIERHADAVVAWAPAKVNLYLEIVAKRPDGYHEIESLLVAVSLYDTLQLENDPSGEVRLECEEAGLPTGPGNLVYRAASLLRARSARKAGAAIRLLKRIPVAAGLAGGSSDAAATIAGLNELWQLRLSIAEMMSLGAELGSDVAFFFSTPAAWCTGRGEVVTRFFLKYPLWFVLLCPPFGLATADVYRAATVPDRAEDSSQFLGAARAGDINEIGRRMHNRLQWPAEKLCPALGRYQTRLKGFGPAGQMLSGSGTSLFALCRNQEEAQAIARGLRVGSEEGMDQRVFIVRSCS
jgi:4-diphosphocytidyl-2-C-methyl-D-erythritol kinase